MRAQRCLVPLTMRAACRRGGNRSRRRSGGEVELVVGVGPCRGDGWCWGGQADYAVLVPDAPRIETGEKVLLFLRELAVRAENGAPLHSIVNLRAGKFRLRDVDGNEVAERDFVANTRFTLGERSVVTARIESVTGQVVSELLSEQSLPEGSHSVVWDARSCGHECASGVCVVEVQGSGWRVAKKLTLLR